MGKKTTLFMLLTAMLLCCFPLEAKAGQTSIDVSRLPNYNFTERTGQISGDGWSWDGTKRQLTLKGAVIYSTFDNVRLPDGTEIILQEGSDNYIVTQNGSYNNGLFSDGDITIKGTGRLYIDSGIGIQCSRPMVGSKERMSPSQPFTPGSAPTVLSRTAANSLSDQKAAL